MGLILCALFSASLGCSETLSGSKPRGSGGTSGSLGGSGDGDAAGSDGDGDGDSDPGGAGSGGAGSGGIDSGFPDTDPPTVISSTPSHGASGVRSDAEIVVEFSEPMDRASTEGAFASSSLPGKPSFTWSEGDTKLTITFDEELAYAEGATTNVVARKYDYAISSGATDRAGNALPSLEVEFSTLRRIATVLLGVPTLDGFAQSDGGDDHPYDSDAVTGWYTDRELVTFLTFDISALPDNISEFEDATLYAFQTDIYYDRTPYAQFGDLQLQHTIFSAVDSDALEKTPLRNLGVFSSSKGASWRSGDVLAALDEDYTLRVTRLNRSQYWLRFSSGPGDNTQYSVTSFYVAEDEENPPRIDVVFLLP